MTDENAKEMIEELATIRRRLMPTPVRTFVATSAAVFLGALAALFVWEAANIYVGGRITAGAIDAMRSPRSTSPSSTTVRVDAREFAELERELEADVKAGKRTREDADRLLKSIRDRSNP